MIEEPPILRIKRPSRRPSAEQIAAFQGVPSAIASDCLYGLGALDLTIKPLAPDMQMAGPALTVDCRPGDLLPLLGALKFISDGDIVTSAFQGYQGCAQAGDRVCGMMKNCGAAAFVTDGPMRDVTGIFDVGLPAWCTGLTPASPVAAGPGTIGHPIQLGGQSIETGDMIVADRDGVTVVPFDRIDDVIAMIPHVLTLEKTLDEKVQNGLTVPDDILQLLDGDKVSITD
ncbi:MAG: RraA family protein [Paracoccaceae bacterium]